MEPKYCPRCRQITTNFSTKKSAYCRPCFAAYVMDRKYGKPRQLLDHAVEDGCLPCSRCKQVKPVSEFHRNKRMKSGHSCYCKDCMNYMKRTEYHDDVEKSRKRLRDRSVNYDPISTMIRYHTRRSRLAGCPWQMRKDEWAKVLTIFGSKCVYCGAVEFITMDHYIPVRLGGGTVMSNVVPACRTCNCSKSGRHPSTWVEPLTAYAIETVLGGF